MENKKVKQNLKLIGIPEKAKIELDKLKEHPRESYGDVVERLLEIAKLCEGFKK